MKKIKVIVTDYVEPDLQWEKEEFRKLPIDFSCFQLKFAAPEELLKRVSDAEILIVNMAKIDAKAIAGLDHCRLIIRHGVGYDNVDVAAAARKNIVVSYIPDYCVNEVAEQAVMLILACQRKLLIQNAILKAPSQNRNWKISSVYPIFSLKDKTLGIIGYGRIGGTVHDMMRGFGLRFMIADPYLSAGKKKTTVGKTYPLKEVLQRSDIITIHVPLNKETYHLIDEKEIALMKKAAVLVNTSRGGVVNLTALDTALRNGQLAHAGIDVYEEEPPAADMPLLHNDRAILTPHLGWLSEEAGWDIRRKIMEDVRQYLNKQQPRFSAVPEIKIKFK